MRRIIAATTVVFAICLTHVVAQEVAQKTEADQKAVVPKAAVVQETKSGPLKTGDAVGAFYVTKIAGAESDGVEAGQELCYRCRYGSRPMVMIFARESGGKFPMLVQELDEAVDKNKASQLRGLVTMMGVDAAKVKQDANQVAEKAGVKHVPVAVAKETETGPVNYRIDNTSDVTVVVANDSQVVSTHTFKADNIDIAAVMNDVKRILN